MKQYETILYDKNGTTATITLNRPGAMNALTRTMFLEIGNALDDAEYDNDIRVVVLKGAGRGFCAGMDLKFASEMKTLQEQQELFRTGNTLVSEKIEGMGKPVIAQVHGACLAGGFEIMMSTDLVVVAEDAIIGDQHVNVALFGGGGCAYRLSLLVGMRKAKEIILMGKRLSGKQAAQMGIVNLAVPVESLDRTVAEMAAELAEKSPVAVKYSKMYINRVSMLDADMRLELAMMYSLVESTCEDKTEGMRAFIEKRKPVWKGR
ncbi:MAG: enoyl-CoA hydratase/isomerase family protein [Dehalococcoidales bacterium]|nr:enoyl-CoA hydratase/isomerase family protein [Dehalococcoidales bacterium]